MLALVALQISDKNDQKRGNSWLFYPVISGKRALPRHNEMILFSWSWDNRMKKESSDHGCFRRSEETSIVKRITVKKQAVWILLSTLYCTDHYCKYNCSRFIVNIITVSYCKFHSNFFFTAQQLSTNYTLVHLTLNWTVSIWTCQTYAPNITDIKYTVFKAH